MISASIRSARLTVTRRCEGAAVPLPRDDVVPLPLRRDRLPPQPREPLVSRSRRVAAALARWRGRVVVVAVWSWRGGGVAVGVAVRWCCVDGTHAVVVRGRHACGGAWRWCGVGVWCRKNTSLSPSLPLIFFDRALVLSPARPFGLTRPPLSCGGGATRGDRRRRRRRRTEPKPNRARCVSATSGTTYAIVGAMNKIPTTLLGFFLFDTPLTAQVGRSVDRSVDRRFPNEPSRDCSSGSQGKKGNQSFPQGINLSHEPDEQSRM